MHVLHVNMGSPVLNHPPITVEEIEKRNLQSRLQKTLSKNLVLSSHAWLFWPIKTHHNRGTNTHLNSDLSRKLRDVIHKSHHDRLKWETSEKGEPNQKPIMTRGLQARWNHLLQGKKCSSSHDLQTKKSQPWMYGEVVQQPTSRSCLVKTAMGPVRRNHA